MREMTVREANQNFSQVIAAAERGETIIITKNGTPVARMTPQTADRTSDPKWVASAQAGAKVLLTEDMRDGRIIESLRLLNPFAAANAEAIAALWAC